MFYKKEENGNWLSGMIVHLPSGLSLDEDNKSKIGGWKWFDEEPEEYTIWFENLNKEYEL